MEFSDHNPVLWGVRKNAFHNTFSEIFFSILFSEYNLNMMKILYMKKSHCS